MAWPAGAMAPRTRPATTGAPRPPGKAGRAGICRKVNPAPAQPWNCSSSVEPVSAVVELCPDWMVWVTASK